MKTIKQILLLTAVITLTVSCTHYDDFFGRHKTKFVTVPFEAEFIGDYMYVGPDNEESTGLEPKCDITRVIVDLFVSISGNVIQGRLDDQPEYITSYWQDPFEILGGTGRYEGASGSGMSNDYNSSMDSNSHHNWSGTITMKK